jgi:hypothetical protein
MDGHSTNKKIFVVMLGSLFILSLACIVTLAIYPGYRIMHWLLLGPGPAKPGVWIATYEGHSIINRVPDVNSEINGSESQRIMVGFPDSLSVPVVQGSDPFFVVHGARPSSPAVIPLKWDGQCYSYSQTSESVPPSLDEKFSIIRLPLFKEKFALLPKTELQPGVYAISLEKVAGLWDHELGPAYYLFEVQ